MKYGNTPHNGERTCGATAERLKGRKKMGDGERREFLKRLCVPLDGKTGSFDCDLRLVEPGVWRREKDRPINHLRINIDFIEEIQPNEGQIVTLMVRTAREGLNLAAFSFNLKTGKILNFDFFDQRLGNLDEQLVAKGPEELRTWQTKNAHMGVDEFLTAMKVSLGPTLPGFSR